MERDSETDIDSKTRKNASGVVFISIKPSLALQLQYSWSIVISRHEAWADKIHVLSIIAAATLMCVNIFMCVGMTTFLGSHMDKSIE